MCEFEVQHSDKELAETKLRLNLDCILHTLSRMSKKDDDWDMKILRHPRHATEKEQIKHCHRHMIKFAKMYVSAAAKYGERIIETVFMSWLRGCCRKEQNLNKWYPVMDQVDMMNEFPLGVVVHFQLRNCSSICYLPQDVEDFLINTMWQHAKGIKEIHEEIRSAPIADTPRPAPSPSPTSTLLSSKDSMVLARVHDKGPRVSRWTGLRQRSELPGPNESRRVYQRSEEDKLASIAAGKARGRALRAAEKERIETAWQRQRLVSLGFDIGQGVD